MLSHAAELDSYTTPSRSHLLDPSIRGSPGSRTRGSINTIPRSEQMQYPLVAKGLLTVDQVAHLVARYVVLPVSINQL